ncbi:MAG: STAS domain-containing protein [Anaerolineales bacterium]|nr:STAS domain-containing protein [Anaerolineales bacterium]
MSTSLEISGEAARIILTGALDFSIQDDLRQIIDETLDHKKIKVITVDMANVTFMDSSAIKLLLLLNKKAIEEDKSLTLVNCRDSIREIFTIGGFDNILTIQ